MEGNKKLTWFEVGSVEELKKRKCRRLYTESGDDLALFCVKEDKFFATSAICPHARGPLDQGDIEELGSNFSVTCPVHFFSFDLQTGVSVSGLKLPTYQTEVRDGLLYVKAAETVSLKFLKSAMGQTKQLPGSGAL